MDMRNDPDEDRAATRNVRDQAEADYKEYSTTNDAGLTSITAENLSKIVFPPLQWSVTGLLPEGTALIAGAPKIGKSMFALNLCVAVATGNDVFGAFKVQQGDAMYCVLEDEGPVRVQERVDAMLDGQRPPGRLHIVTDMERIGEGCIEQLTAAVEDHPDLRLIIIDTLQRVMSTGRNQGKYAVDYESVGPLRKFAHGHNMTVGLVHHTRETEAPDWTDLVAGSRGLIANVDAIMVAKRGRGSADVIMHVTGNDIPESEHAFNAESMEWKLLGDATVAQLNDSRRIIMESLELSGRATPKAIAEETGMSPSSVGHLVKRMTGDALLRNYGDGTYGLFHLTERT